MDLDAERVFSKVLPVILVIKENWLPLMNLMCMKFYFKLHHGQYP